MDSIGVAVGLGVTTLGRSVHVAPVGQPVSVSSTFPVNPLSAVTVTVDDPLSPCNNVNEDGSSETEKSGSVEVFAYAATSVMRLHFPSAVAEVSTRIFEVDNAANVN